MLRRKRGEKRIRERISHNERRGETKAKQFFTKESGKRRRRRRREEQTKDCV